MRHRKVSEDRNQRPDLLTCLLETMLELDAKPLRKLQLWCTKARLRQGAIMFRAIRTIQGTELILSCQQRTKAQLLKRLTTQVPTQRADLSQDATALHSDHSEAAPPIGPAVEETDPALQSLVSEEAAFGASSSPPSPEPESRFDALSPLAPAKEEDVTFESLTAELEREPGVVEHGLEEPAASCEEDPITHPESENPENTADLESSNPLEPHREPDSDRTLSPVEVPEFPDFPEWGEGVPEEVAQEGTEESRAAAPVHVQFSEEAEEEEVPPPPTSLFLVSEGAATGAPTTEPIQVGHSASAPSRLLAKSVEEPKAALPNDDLNRSTLGNETFCTLPIGCGKRQGKGGTGGSVRPPTTIPVFTGTAGEPYDQSDPYSLSDEVFGNGASSAPPSAFEESQTVTLRERRSAFKVRRRTSTTRQEPDPVEPAAPDEDLEEIEVEPEAAAAADDPSSEPPEAPEELGDEEEEEEEEHQEEDAVVEEAAEAPQGLWILKLKLNKLSQPFRQLSKEV
eukprot:s140_g48.t1